MMIPWDTAVAVFLGTLPLLVVMIWNLVEIRRRRVLLSERQRVDSERITSVLQGIYKDKEKT